MHLKCIRHRQVKHGTKLSLQISLPVHTEQRKIALGLEKPLPLIRSRITQKIGRKAKEEKAVD